MGRKCYLPQGEAHLEDSVYLLRLSKKVFPGVISFQFLYPSVQRKSFITNYNLYKIVILCYPWAITFIGRKSHGQI